MARAPGTWPLTAAATRILRDPDEKGSELLKLALKELVLRRVWAIEEREQRRRLGGTRRVKAFVPGTRPVPDAGPLPRVDAALRAEVGPEGQEVRETVKQIVGSGQRLTRRTREDALDEAEAFGLLTVERRKVLGLIPHTRIALTPNGDVWRRDSYEREEALTAEIRSPMREPAARAATMAGIVLLLSPPLLAELDEAVIRLQAAGAADFGSFDAGALDLEDLSALDGMDSSFDSAVDAGASDSGGGGDGGGGDGGGS